MRPGEEVTESPVGLTERPGQMYLASGPDIYKPWPSGSHGQQGQSTPAK